VGWLFPPPPRWKYFVVPHRWWIPPPLLPLGVSLFLQKKKFCPRIKKLISPLVLRFLENQIYTVGFPPREENINPYIIHEFPSSQKDPGALPFFGPKQNTACIYSRVPPPPPSPLCEKPPAGCLLIYGAPHTNCARLKAHKHCALPLGAPLLCGTFQTLSGLSNGGPKTPFPRGF